MASGSRSIDAGADEVGSRSIHAGSDEVFQNNCDVCLTQKMTSEAKSYCTVCDEHLCQRCEQAHKGSKATRSHTIVTGISITSGSTKKKQTIPIMFCESHKTSLLEIYCKTHDDVICSMCKMGSHTECNTVDVSRHTSIGSVAGAFMTFVKSMTDLQSRFTKLQAKRKDDRSTAKTQIQTCLQEMNQIRKDVNDMLDKLEKKMAAEIRKYEDKLQKEIDGHEATSKKVLQHITDLNKSLDECQKTRDDDVMFIGMKKAGLRKKEFEKIIGSIMTEIYPIKIHIKPNEILTDMIGQLQTLGTLLTGEQTQYRESSQTSNTAGQMTPYIKTFPKSLLKMTVRNKQEEIDLASEDVCGCTFMPDGHLVVACFKDGLKLFDRTFKYKSQLSVKSNDVAVINDTDVLVTQGWDKQLQRVQVLPTMEVKSTIKMDRGCFGVDVAGAKIYTTCHDNPGNGEVRVMDMAGNTLKGLGVDNDACKFEKPNYVKVSKDGSKLFVADWDTHIVTCLNQQGQVIYRYSDNDLKNPVGMYVDGEDNLLVCGVNSRNVHVVRHDGKRKQILLKDGGWDNLLVCGVNSRNVHVVRHDGKRKQILLKDGGWGPSHLSYRQSDGCLAVVRGQGKYNTKLVIFTTKI